MQLGRAKKRSPVYENCAITVRLLSLRIFEPARLLAEKGKLRRGTGATALARRNGVHRSWIDLREAAIYRQQGFLDESYELLVTAHEDLPHEFWPCIRARPPRSNLAISLPRRPLPPLPPPPAANEAVLVAKLQAQFHKARWALDAAIEFIDSAIAIDDADPALFYEGARLKMITLDLQGSRDDLVAYADIHAATIGQERRSANPSQSHVGQLYEEYTIDMELRANLVQLRKLSSERQVWSKSPD